MLPSLRKLLEDSMTSAPAAQTLALFTPPGALIAYASRAAHSPADPLRSFGRDDVRTLVGLAVDFWTQECGPVSEERTLMVECEVRPTLGADLHTVPNAALKIRHSQNLGRLVVVPVYADNQDDADEWPVMLLAVHGGPDADFDDLAAAVSFSGFSLSFILSLSLCQASGPAEELAAPLASYPREILNNDSPIAH